MPQPGRERTGLTRSRFNREARRKNSRLYFQHFRGAETFQNKCDFKAWSCLFTKPVSGRYSSHSVYCAIEFTWMISILLCLFATQFPACSIALLYTYTYLCVYCYPVLKIRGVEISRVHLLAIISETLMSVSAIKEPWYLRCPKSNFLIDNHLELI